MPDDASIGAAEMPDDAPIGAAEMPDADLVPPLIVDATTGAKGPPGYRGNWSFVFHLSEKAWCGILVHDDDVLDRRRGRRRRGDDAW
jgi:hypothetical protein